jgi:hypothetical protein
LSKELIRRLEAVGASLVRDGHVEDAKACTEAIEVLRAADWLANEIDVWGKSGVPLKGYVWVELIRFMRKIGRPDA